MSAVDLVVEFDRAIRGSETGAVRERHVLCERRVYVAVAEAGGLATRTCEIHEWRAELEKVCRPPDGWRCARGDHTEPDLPWELLVATGRALAEHRHDLYDELVARATPELRPVLRRLHRETAGRLRVVGTLPTRRRVGWISWVLLSDGWQSLTPYVTRTAGTTRPMVRLEHRGPGDLVRVMARWTAEARR